MVVFNLGPAVPTASFYLEHHDPNSMAGIYFDSSLDFTTQASIVPSIILPLLLSD